MLRDSPASLAAPADECQLPLIKGRIKWFSTDKGYGFVAPDDGSPDIMLHMKVARRDGFHEISENAGVLCMAEMGPKGLAVVRLMAIDASTALAPRAKPAPVPSMPLSSFEPVVVKWFNRAKGFGFLSRGEATDDIFVHIEILRQHGIHNLDPGARLLVRYGESPKGLQALDVRILQPAHVA